MGARTIHPFPARMAPEIALNVIPERTKSGQLTVADPMCGSGTVLSAALNRGHHAIGVDIDPLAILMSKVATTAISTGELISLANRICKDVGVGGQSVSPIKDEETQKFVDFWFGPQQKSELSALSFEINEVEEEHLRNALQVGLSRIIVTKTPKASLAADTSHSRPHRVVESSTYSVMDGFVHSIRSLCRLLDARDIRGRANVCLGDSRKLGNIEDDSVDLVVTSPPYLNALDYMRGHKMALVWFGYSIRDLRMVRSTSIGAERRPDQAPDLAVNSLVDLVRNNASHPDALPLGTLQRFAGDMVGLAQSVHRILRDGKCVTLVVGNSTLRGNYIENDRVAQNAFESQGFSLASRVERDIPDSSRYMAINTLSASSSIRKRMRSEIILTLEKSG